MQPTPRSKVERVRTQSSFKAEGLDRPRASSTLARNLTDWRNSRHAMRFEARWREIIACWHSRHAMRLTRPAPESYQTAKPGLMPPLLLMPQAKDRANSLGAADQDGPSSF